MSLLGIGSVGNHHFQGPPVVKSDPRATEPRPDSAMWGNSVTSGSKEVPGPDSAMWGNAVTSGGKEVPSPDSAMWGNSVTSGRLDVMA